MEQATTEAVVASLERVRERVGGRAELIAVSKTKPAELVAAAHAAGHRHFGENYAQELVAKAPLLPPDVRWHFIGHLQTNKVKELLAVPNLACVHTVDTLKLARELDKRSAALRAGEPLDVMVQVNTSAEVSKSGCAPEECVELCREVSSSCASLRLAGLMCIGKYSADEGGAADDFACLVRCRALAAASLGVEPTSLSLSMGMSHDYEEAISAGATHVRVGSTIFGARAPKPASAAS